MSILLTLFCFIVTRSSARHPAFPALLLFPSGSLYPHCWVLVFPILLFLLYLVSVLHCVYAGVCCRWLVGLERDLIFKVSSCFCIMGMLRTLCLDVPPVLQRQNNELVPLERKYVHLTDDGNTRVM